MNKTQKKDLASLTLLGAGGKNKPLKKLESFPNKTDRPYLIELTTEEFTCLCPMTGQPDFAKIKISYVPGKKILESKSLKMYLWSFRNTGCFHEHVVNAIIDDIAKAVEPVWCMVEGDFNARGGIAIKVKAQTGTRPENV